MFSLPTSLVSLLHTDICSNIIDPSSPASTLEAHGTFSPNLRKSPLVISTHFVPAVLVWNMLLQALFTAEQLCAFLTFK